MKMQVVVNSSGEVIGTVAITPTITGKNAGVVGVAPLPEQTVYELEIPEPEMPKDALELHNKCEQAIKRGAASKIS